MSAREWTEWREQIGRRVFLAMTCTHDFDGVVCETCWDNTQRVCALIEQERAEAIAQHCAATGCDETPALRERLANEDLLVQRIAVGWKCDHEFSGATCERCFRNISHAADVATRTRRSDA